MRCNIPEIAEVRIFSDQLTKEFGGQSLQNITVVGGRFLKENIAGLNSIKLPLKNSKFNTKGKFMYWTFEEDKVFFITLGMAASFGPQSKHSALKFTFDEGSVYFNDIRHFGTFKISDRNGLNTKLATLGWDAIAEPVMPAWVPEALRKSGAKTIAEVLLNQKLFAGVGNYIRSEAMYLSGIHPLRTVHSLSDKDISNLCTKIVQVANEAYAKGGATIATFKDMYGNTGKFFDSFKVYSKKQTIDGKPIQKITAPDGRSVFFVKDIQT